MWPNAIANLKVQAASRTNRIFDSYRATKDERALVEAAMHPHPRPLSRKAGRGETSAG
jgi:hypothetical protein